MTVALHNAPRLLPPLDSDIIGPKFEPSGRQSDLAPGFEVSSAAEQSPTRKPTKAPTSVPSDTPMLWLPTSQRAVQHWLQSLQFQLFDLPAADLMADE
jgi:hypothetical protein